MDNQDKSTLPQKTLMILAGGSGGHIYPALAVAEKLLNYNVKIVWLGSRDGLEGRITFPDYVENEWIDIKGFVGKGLLSWLNMPFRLMAAVIQSLKIIKKHQPDLVLGTGGFVAAPGGIAAFIKRVPLIIHESNAVAGLTNKMLSKLTTRTLVAIADTKGLSDKQIVVGNPVRKSLVDLLQSHKAEDAMTESNSAAEKKLRIAVVGGSQGAQVFNEVLPSALGGIEEVSLSIKHQTGKNKLSGVVDKYNAANKAQLHDIEVFEYIEDMAHLYQNTDLIICRAGAMTIAEIALAGLPAIIVPYPNSAGDHQLENARYYQRQHAGVLIEQSEFHEESVQQVITTLLKNKEKLAKMAERARLIAEPEAATKAAKICWEIINA